MTGLQQGLFSELKQAIEPGEGSEGGPQPAETEDKDSGKNHATARHCCGSGESCLAGRGPLIKPSSLKSRWAKFGYSKGYMASGFY